MFHTNQLLLLLSLLLFEYTVVCCLLLLNYFDVVAGIRIQLTSFTLVSLLDVMCAIIPARFFSLSLTAPTWDFLLIQSTIEIF
jgi:hypothetical protein